MSSHLPLLSGVLLVDDGLHLVPVLHQHHREIFVGELAHGEGEVVRPRDPAAEQAGFGLKVASDVDVHGVKVDRHPGPALHAAGARHREGRAQFRLIRQLSRGAGAAGAAHAEQANQKSRWEKHRTCRGTTSTQLGRSVWNHTDSLPVM